MERRRGGLGRKRFSSPPFHRQSRRLRTGVREQKVAALGAMSLREQANLYSPLSEGVPTLLSPPPYTPTHPPPVTTGNRKVQRRKEREPGNFEPRILLPLARGWNSRGRRSYTGWEGKSKGLGITHRCPARAAAPSLAPWAGGKGGERAGGLRGENRVAARCGLLRAHPRRGPGPGLAPLPPPRARRSSPAQLQRVGGGADGWGGPQGRCQGGQSPDWWV